MEISQGLLLALFAWGALCGAALGIVYDVFRILRIAHGDVFFGASAKKIRRFTGYAAIFVEDIVFALICAFVITVLIYQANSGKIRGIAIAGVFGGFYIYYNTIGRLVIAAADFIIGLIKKAVHLVYLYTFVPIKKLTAFIAKCIAIFSGNMYNKIYTAKRMKSEIKSAGRGFSYCNEKRKDD